MHNKSNPEGTHQSLTIIGSDGQHIPAHCYAPQSDAKGVLIIGPAMAVSQRFYSDFAGFMADRGYVTYTFDYRGIGEARPKQMARLSADLASWAVNDLAPVIRTVRERHPELPCGAICHSVSGQLTGLIPETRELDALILVASQSGYWRHWSGMGRFRVWLLWHVLIPFLTPLFGYFPAKKLGIFANLPAGVARQWARWGRSPHYLFDHIPENEHHFSGIKLPGLNISFSDDPYGPNAATAYLREKYAQVNWTVRQYGPKDIGGKPLGHFRFYKQQFSEQFWVPTLNWIDRNMNSSSSPNQHQTDESTDVAR